MPVIPVLSSLLSPSVVALAHDVGAGLTTGVPLMAVVGPISLMLVDVGVQRGLRSGTPAAVGVALGDLVCALVVTLFGTALATALGSVATWFRLVAALLLVGLAVHVVGEAVRSRRPVPEPAPVPGPGVVDHSSTPARRLVGGFMGLTLANPLSLLVYAGLVVGGGAGAGTIGWVLGMAGASLLVHGGYVGLGHLVGSTMPPAALRALRLVAAAMLLGFAAHLLL
ncbi:LysE family transporter [Dermatobacter hominis]|uniref:LysE family transporter n=1 Tax=Dermatobacter hominis TaxID=2884263 RepID=UPI001D127D67|nr:LysE family transporter [Dermatobacter hominis]UDY37795.1 LysE family transporter [Dermatobacter hominis]